MAGYDYTYRDYPPGKGTGPHINEWSKTSYANDDECRTVIVDADGTRRTIVGCTPFHKPESYVVKTETIIRERVHSPVFPSYKHSTPTKIEPAVKDYRFADEKLPRLLSPVKGHVYTADDKLPRPFNPVKGHVYAADDKLPRPFNPVKGHVYAADDKLPRPFNPVKGHVYAADDKLPRPFNPVKGYAYAADDKPRRPSSPVHDYPQEIGDFLTKVQTEASRDQPTETIIHEHVHSPVFPSYKHSSPTKVVQPVKDYMYADDKWRRPSSPPKGYGYEADDHHKLRRPSSPVHDYPREVQPVKDYKYADDKWHRPSSPPKGYDYAADDHHKLRRPSSPVHDYPREVQTQASHDQPSRIGPFNGLNWCQPPQKTGHNGTTGYGDYNDYSNNDYSNKTLYKPQNDDYDNYNRKKDSDKGPNMISNGDRVMPSPSTWAARPVHDGRLSIVTDDMETALQFLMESAKSSSVTTATPHSRGSALPKQGEYPMEAGKRHVRFNLSP